MNHQSITAEGIAKRKNSQIPWNSSIEIGDLVFAHEEEYLMYNPRKITLNQMEMLIAIAPPTLSNPVLKTKAQQRGIWKTRVAQELKSIGRSMLCIWKYLTSGCNIAYAKSAGRSQIVNLPASCAIRGSCPVKTSMFSMLIQMKDTGRQTNMREKIAVYVCIPILWYCFAP